MKQKAAISLEQRLRRARSSTRVTPLAVWLPARDFLESTGRMLGEHPRYQTIYELKIRQYCGDGDQQRTVCELVHAARHLPPQDRDPLLYWLLIEPFVYINSVERRKKHESED